MGSKIKLIILFSILFHFCGYSQNNHAEKSLTDLFTWFNPYMRNAYKHYPIKGSGKINDYAFEHGKLKSYSRSYMTESNGIYHFSLKEQCDSIIYADNIIKILHSTRKKGFPDSSLAKEKGLKNNWNISAHYHTFNISDSIVKINDSTFIYKGIPLFITITKNHWKINTKNDDLWDIDIILTDGLPIRIIHNGKITTYRYLTYDSFGNWVKREIIDEKGNSMIQVREIAYSCKQCGGNGWCYWRCPQCSGTGVCVPKRRSGPDESIGICPQCGGKKFKFKCKLCNI